MATKSSSKRKATNVSLEVSLVEAARELDINVSRACEAGLAHEIKREREARWKAQNAQAIASWNEWLAENGMPLERYRMF